VIGETLAGRYELEEVVGSGGMSSVYRAYDRQLDRRVALKVLHEHHAEDDEHVARFRREAWAAAQLSHPNLVTVLDRGVDAGRQFIVFEYVEGESLKDLVDRTGPLPPKQALELAIAIADALAFAHAQGLVHRDVKPQNVLLDADGGVKVTDFGIARSLDAHEGVTLTGTILGTSSYISPEQASGTEVTPATDVYSLGVVLWELLTGEVPFPGDNFVAVALRHINERPPSLLGIRPDVSARLAAAVDRALAKEPSARFPSMEAFAWELRACLDELDPDRTAVLAPPRPARARPARHSPRRRKRLVALLAVALVAGAAAYVALVYTGASGHGGPGTGGAAVALRGVATYDPQGDGQEHSATALLATDGDPATSWTTETYATPDFGGLKDGVGLVLDAGAATTLSSITVSSGSPGFEAEILAGDASGGPFTPDSGSQTVGASATFDLHGASARYYVLWITRLPPGGRADVAEVTARG